MKEIDERGELRQLRNKCTGGKGEAIHPRACSLGNISGEIIMRFFLHFL